MTPEERRAWVRERYGPMPDASSADPRDLGKRHVALNALDLNIGNALNGALFYAALGWPVFPLQPGAKVPYPMADTKGLGWRDYAATDPEEIRETWRDVPAANVAIATGAPGPDVLDIDVGPRASEALAKLTDAGFLKGARGVARTRSGGLHFFYAGSAQGNRGGMGGYPVDFRGLGGYVVASPSFVAADSKPAGVYEWSQWLDAPGVVLDVARVCALLEPPRPPRPRRSAVMRAGSSQGRVAGVLRWLEEENARNPGEGGRHDRFKWPAQALASAGLDEAQAFEVLHGPWLACGKDSDYELRSLIRWGLEHPLD